MVQALRPEAEPCVLAAAVPSERSSEQAPLLAQPEVEAVQPSVQQPAAEVEQPSAEQAEVVAQLSVQPEEVVERGAPRAEAVEQDAQQAAVAELDAPRVEQVALDALQVEAAVPGARQAVRDAQRVEQPWAARPSVAPSRLGLRLARRRTAMRPAMTLRRAPEAARVERPRLQSSSAE